MDIRDLKHAEGVLINSTQNSDIKNIIDQKIEDWEIELSESCLEVITNIKKLLLDLYKELLEEGHDDDTNMKALQWIVFEKIHDIFIPSIRTKFYEDDLLFFEKSKYLCDIKVSAEQFGANENYTIPLSAAVVELSVIDSYKSPIEKMNCLWSTYDLVFAEIKTAMISMISESSDRENDIPVIDNKEILPILMVVIVRSKLVHILSNLCYIKSFYHQLDKKYLIFNIFKAFETAVNKIFMMDVQSIQATGGKVLQSIDLEDYIKITCSGEQEIPSRTLIDDANKRILNLITRSTNENEGY